MVDQQESIISGRQGAGMVIRRAAQGSLLVVLLLVGLVGCGSLNQDDQLAVMAKGATGPSRAQRESVEIAQDELKILIDDTVSSSIKLPAELSPTISGFGPIVAATTPGRDLLAYLGWDPKPAFKRAEEGQRVEPGTPLGTQVLYIVDLDNREHREIRGVVSFALRPNGDIAYVQTADTQVLSQTPQSTRLVHRSAEGGEVVVANDGYFRAARWSDGVLLYTDALSSEPGPFMLRGYSPSTGKSVEVGEGLSVFTTLDDGSVLVVPNHDSFIGNLQRFDVRAGQLKKLKLAANDETSDDIRVVGLGLSEGGEIIFHGVQGPSTIEVVGRMKVIGDVVEVPDVVSLDVGSIQGIEQINVSSGGSISGWGLNPRAMPKGPADVDRSLPQLVEFICASQCEYLEVHAMPAIRVTTVPEELG